MGILLELIDYGSKLNIFWSIKWISMNLKELISLGISVSGCRDVLIKLRRKMVVEVATYLKRTWVTTILIRVCDQKKWLNLWCEKHIWCSWGSASREVTVWTGTCRGWAQKLWVITVSRKNGRNYDKKNINKGKKKQLDRKGHEMQ